MKTIYYAPERVENFNDSVFLAGSIDNGEAEDWQSFAEKLIQKEFPYYTILNPRRKDWKNDVVNDFKDPSLYQQVNWEMDCMDQCSIILMYFSPNSKSPITLLELGAYASSGKLRVICSNSFYRKGNVEIFCYRQKMSVKMTDSLSKNDILWAMS